MRDEVELKAGALNAIPRLNEAPKSKPGLPNSVKAITAETAQ